MFRLAADENLTHAIVRGLLRRNPSIDVVRVQDVGLSGVDDPSLLDWAAREERVVLTHDSSTMTQYAYDRVREGKKMAGVIEVSLSVAPGQVIEDILLLMECTTAEDWQGQILYLPM